MMEKESKIKGKYLTSEKKEALQVIIDALKDQIWSKDEIAIKLHEGLSACIGFSGVNIYFLDPMTYSVEFNWPVTGYWPFPTQEKDWLIQRTKDLQIKNTNEPIDQYYIQNREASIFVDKNQLKIDRADYGFNCQDGLYWILLSEDEIILGFIFINNWAEKKLLYENPNALQIIYDSRILITTAAMALDNFMIHRKIETLLTDKQKLKERLKKDEEDLRRRLLEQSVLYDTSDALSHHRTYYPMENLIFNGLKRVLAIDVCAILLLDFTSSSGAELLLRSYSTLPESFLKAVQNNIINTTIPFVHEDIPRERINITTEQQYDAPALGGTALIKSFANVPLVFKEEVLGMLNVCSLTENAFSGNELTFLYTMANQLSSHLGRLRVLRELEKTKIGSMITSMTEGVIMLDENNHLDMINSAAKDLLGFPKDRTITAEELIYRLEELELMELYYDTFLKGDSILNHEHMYKDKILSTNITPVMDRDNTRIGMVMVLRDVTELQKINRVNKQRLTIISKVNQIINSIADLDSLLTFLIEFILNTANAEMGSIQLRDGKTFRTKVHSNFPDKIRREYKFNNNETFSEFVVNTKEICYIADYQNNPAVSQNTKIIIDFYICIPIFAKKDLIGILNIVKKSSDRPHVLHPEDIENLKTITDLSGTAIHNAVLYQDTIKKQKLDQELRVAHEIQKKLLPSALPEFPNFNFGAISIPAREIGGDYYEFFTLDSGKLGIIIADIVGKGIPAALLMVMIKSMLRSNVALYDSPKEALGKMNTMIEKDPAIDKYVPIFYGILDPETLLFKYCNAGHEPSIIFTGVDFESLDTDGFPLGAWPDSAYEEKELQFKQNDIFLMFTDGIIEARNEEEEEFGHARVKEVVRQYWELDAQDIVDRMFDSVLEHSGSKDQHDDLTLVVLKIGPKLMVEDRDQPIAIKELRVTSSKQNISLIRNELDRITAEMGFEPEDQFNIKLAVNEAQANVVEHAYRGSEKGEIIFKFMVFPNRLEILIKDFGKGMDQKTIKGEKHLDELEGSGLGVYLIHTLMDKVQYNKKARIGTELLLTKYLKKET